MTDSQNPQQYGRDAEFTELLAANAALQKRVEQLEGVGQREKYARRLDALSQTHLLNTDEELNRVCEMTPEDAESHFGVIAEHYQRNPHAIPELDVYQKSGEPGIRLEADGGLPKDLSEQVTKYAMKNGLDWAEARAAFLKDHAPAVPAA